HLLCAKAYHFTDAFFKPANSGFIRVIFYNGFQYALAKFYFVIGYSVLLNLFWHEMTLGNFYFLFYRITVYLYHFHTVAQGWMNRAQRICSSDKHYVREIVIKFNIIVIKRAVLFGIKYFEHCR